MKKFMDYKWPAIALDAAHNEYKKETYRICLRVIRIRKN